MATTTTKQTHHAITRPRLRKAKAAVKKLNKIVTSTQQKKNDEENIQINNTENDMAGVCCGVVNGSQIELQIFGPKLC